MLVFLKRKAGRLIFLKSNKRRGRIHHHQQQVKGAVKTKEKKEDKSSLHNKEENEKSQFAPETHKKEAGRSPPDTDSKSVSAKATPRLVLSCLVLSCSGQLTLKLKH